MRVSVIIPTTDGPARVLRLAPLQSAPRSVMRTQDDYRPLPVSSAYQAFTEPGGPLDMAFGLRGAAFDLRLSARIDTGRSWELPVALAHWLQAEGHELVAEGADLAVWATAALDLDMDVIAEDYHLAAKLTGSLPLLQGLARDGARILILLPGDVLVPQGLPKNAMIRRVAAVADAAKALEALLTPEVDGAVASGSAASARSSHAGLWALGGVGLATVAALTLFGPSVWQRQAVGPEPSGDITVASVDAPAGDDAPLGDAAPDREPGTALEAAASAQTSTVPGADALPSLVLLRPGEGARCIDLHFADADPSRETVSMTAGGFEDAALAGACALGLALPEQAPGGLTIRMPEPLMAHVTRSERQAEFTLAPGEERLFRLVAELPDRLDLTWRVIDRAGVTVEIRHSLTAGR